jgi:hypothetical protein
MTTEMSTKSWPVHTAPTAVHHHQTEAGCPERTCDRCKIRIVELGLDELFEIQEFVQIRVRAGYGARRFEDGDVWEAVLCQDCAFELFAPFARRLATQDDWFRTHFISVAEAGPLFGPDFDC